MNDPLALPWTPVADGLGFSSIYWVRGSTKPGMDGKRNEVEDPPTSGWSTTYVLYEPDASSVTLFNPYSFKTHVVSTRSAEYDSLKPTPHDHVDWAAKLPDDAPMMASSVHWQRATMKANWKSHARGSEPRDFDMAAKVLKMLGGPDMTAKAAARRPVGSSSPAGGKEVAASLTKKVKRKGRKGEVLAFFVEAEGNRGNLNALTAKVGIDRKNALSQLYLLKKDHGIGYAISGDEVQVTLPEGDDDPFE